MPVSCVPVNSMHELHAPQTEPFVNKLTAVSLFLFDTSTTGHGQKLSSDFGVMEYEVIPFQYMRNCLLQNIFPSFRALINEHTCFHFVLVFLALFFFGYIS